MSLHLLDLPYDMLREIAARAPGSVEGARFLASTCHTLHTVLPLPAKGTLDWVAFCDSDAGEALDSGFVAGRHCASTQIARGGTMSAFWTFKPTLQCTALSSRAYRSSSSSS